MPLLTPELAEHFTDMIKANMQSPTLLRMIADADQAIKDVTSIRTILIYGYKHMNASTASAQIARMNAALAEQTRMEIKRKEAERKNRAMQAAVGLCLIGVFTAFVSLFIAPWLFNLILIPTMFTFSGWGLWYTRRNIRRMQARWVLEDIQRRTGVKE